jgi:hypothetical protein
MAHTMGICNGWERALFALGATLVVSACDPTQDAPSSTQDGPTFLTVLPAAEQPISPEEGVAVVVQARGGTQVGITTIGGQHRYSGEDIATSSSCAELPGTQPLYLLVKPDDRACVLEVRLYADCDPDDGGSAKAMCMSGNGGFLASAFLPIAAPVFNRDGSAPPQADAGHDASRDGGGLDAATALDGASGSDGGLDGAPRIDAAPRNDAASDAPQGDR